MLVMYVLIAHPSPEHPASLTLFLSSVPGSSPFLPLLPSSVLLMFLRCQYIIMPHFAHLAVFIEGLSYSNLHTRSKDAGSDVIGLGVIFCMPDKLPVSVGPPFEEEGG